MPLVAKGPLSGFYLPDYDGGSLVNLMGSVIRSRGGRSPHPDLTSLPSTRIEGAKNVVYVLIDGMGCAQVERHLQSGSGQGFLAASPYRPFSTVFPATTAAAVTTFSTGASPLEHGILNWFLHLHDLGVVSTILPLQTRTGMPLVPEDYDLRAYLRIPSHLDTTLGRREFLAFGEIATSRYSRLGTRWTHTASFTTLDGMVSAVAASARRPGRGVAYAYWPEYDTLCHTHGWLDARPARHLEEVDKALVRLVENLRGTDTALLVVADHGFVDTPVSRRIDLAGIKEFYDCLTVVPSGDARSVSCFVRPARVQRFKEVVEANLAEACLCIAGEELLATGAFGPGTAHPALHNRLADFILLAKEDYAFSFAVAGWPASFCVGNHGGMSEAEVRVPLYLVGC